jgi:hypothetical protein
MNHNGEVPGELGGLGDVLPADVLKKLNELLERLHQAEGLKHGGNIMNDFQGATIHNLVINGNMAKRGTEHYHTAKTTQRREQEEAKRMTNVMGRPMAEELASCFKEGVDAGACIERMRPYIVGEKGKQVVLVLKAAYKLEWFEKMPIFPQLVREYGELGRSSGFNEQMRNGFFSDDEVETMMQKLKQ